MRILYITFEKPSWYYGGGRAIIQSLESISKFAEIDYVGLEFDVNQFPQFNIRNTYFLRKSKNVFSSIKNMFAGLPTFYYSSWKKIARKLNFAEYDEAFVEFSHLDFVVRKLKRNNLGTIVRTHNIESDMIKSVLRAKKFSRHKLRAFLNGKKILKREKRAFDFCDKVIFLTREDLNRACALYDHEIIKKSIIIPICMNPVDCESIGEKAFDFHYAIVTGSLNYGANAEGIAWLINEVWKPLTAQGAQGSMKLVVAGSKPTAEMKELCENTTDCILVDTPQNMGTYLAYADFYIAPIFDGAGMKVKVAEALAYGLKIVGTNHAFIGYDMAEDFLIRANSDTEFKEQVLNVMRSLPSEEEKNRCKQVFMDNFSNSVSVKLYGEVLTSPMPVK